jgi:acetyltransferase
MSTYRLDRLFAPRSVALVGANPRPKSVGRTVLQNLRTAGFEGPVHLINPDFPEIDGVKSVPRIEDLPEAPDVVVIAVPPPAVPATIASAGAKGCGAAVIITSGLGHGPGSLAAETNQIARTYGLRLVGPNCLGILIPRAKLNASFAARMPNGGSLALISQSGAIVAGLLEWAAHRAVGFSAVVSLGDKVYVDFGDLLDFFAAHRDTRAILLYVEAIDDARKFMSAARAAAHSKPVVVIKSGRHAQGAKAAATHTGALAGSDAVYDAAFRRAGLLRVFDLDELFAAAETLGRLRPFSGRRLAILTNGGGLGVLAVDQLIDLGGSLANLSPQTIKHLDSVLPAIWSKANPVDIVGDADGERYRAGLEELLSDSESDAILVMNVPTALASPVDAANATAAAVQKHRSTYMPAKPVLAVWVGQESAGSRVFNEAGIPHYTSEFDAVRGFMHLVRYREAQDASMQAPPSLPEDFTPDATAARSVVAAALADGRSWLDPIECIQLFSAYVIPILPAVLARNADEAAAAAKPFFAKGETVVAKILSPDIVHKSEVGGVRLNLRDEREVRDATTDIMARARALRPEAHLTGVTIHPMVVRAKARELIAGLADDPTFGPVIVFGYGGTAVEVIADKALALPPLDLKLARDLIARTRASRLLKAYRDVPAADEESVALVLVKLAQLAADIPEIRELDLNPLLADHTGVIAVDARVAIARAPVTGRGSGHPRFAIRPYPKEWERHLTLKDGSQIFVRPVRPEDRHLYEEFFPHLSAQDLRLRFFAPIKEFSPAFIARLTHLDYGRAMALLALDERSGTLLGVVRLHINAAYDSGEYAVLVRSDLKGRGLGWQLMQLVIEYARQEGLHTIEGQVLRENSTMLTMCRQLGFSIESDPNESDICRVKLSLSAKAAQG